METLDIESRVKWQVSLSNGETYQEGKGDFKRVDGEKSPWQKLLSYTALKEVLITSLSLYTDDGHRYNLPSAGNNPKFAVFETLPKPIDFIFARKMARDHDVMIDDKGQASITNTEIADMCAVIEAVYKEYRLQVWVSEYDPKVSWAVVIPHGV